MGDSSQYLFPTSYGVAITTSDATVYSPPLRVLYVGGAGNVAIKTRGGQSVTLTAVPVGSRIDWVLIERVLATGTTATLLVGFR